MKNALISQFFLFFLFLFVSINPAYAGKIFKGWLIKNDGTRIEKYIEFFFAGDDKITCFDNTEKKNKIKIKSEKIKEIGIIIEADNDTTVFHKFKLAKYGLTGKLKVGDDFFWATLIHHTDKVEAYEMYYDDPNYRRGVGGSSFYAENVVAGQCSKFPENDFIVYHTQIDSTSDPFHAFDKIMRKTFAELTKTKCPAMKEKIDEKKYKVEQFIEMLDQYTVLCN